MEKLTIDEALTYSSGSNFYQKRMVVFFSIGQFAIAFLVMGIPLMFPEFDEVCDMKGFCQIPKDFKSTASAELGVYGKSKSKISYIGTAYFIGMMIFALLVSWLSDNKGRKTVILICACLSSCIIATLAFSNSFWLVIVVYFFFGGTELGVYCSGFILLTESVEPSKRNIYSGMALCSWGLGSMILMGLFMAGVYWRTILIISCCCMSSYVLLLKYIHESPRWLYQNQNTSQDVVKVLDLISQTNGVGKFDLEIKSEFNGNEGNLGYKVFLYNNELFRTVSICICIWTAIVMVYYSMIFMMASFIENVYLEGMVLAFAETIATFLVSYFINIIGRKTAAIFCFLLCALAFMLIALVPLIFSKGSSEIIVICLSFLARASVSAEFNLFYIYIAELFPTSVRNMAFGLCNNIGRLGGILSSHVPSLCKLLRLNPYIFLSFALILSAVLSSFLEETLNKEMKDLIGPKNSSDKNSLDN
jgi:MFS family permease